MQWRARFTIFTTLAGEGGMSTNDPIADIELDKVQVDPASLHETKVQGRDGQT